MQSAKLGHKISFFCVSSGHRTTGRSTPFCLPFLQRVQNTARISNVCLGHSKKEVRENSAKMGGNLINKL